MNRITTTLATIGLGMGALVGVAAADPPPAPIPQTLVDRANADEPIQLNEDRIKLQTKGATDVRFQRVVYPAGAASGWHTHPGFVLVAVASGTITMYNADCGTMAHGPNEVFIEHGDELMQLANLSGSEVVLYATFVVPDGAPYRIDSATPPACAS